MQSDRDNQGETLAHPTAVDGHETSVPSIPGYEVIEELGRGGMGVVYKAWQVRPRRVVALKMVLAGEHAAETDLVRFRTEAEALGRLQHPNIVQIHEVGEWRAGNTGPALPYFSLEYCSAGSLEDRLGGTPLPPLEAARLVETLARAMHAAHQASVVHRDLKPANILLQNAKSDIRNPKEDKSHPRDTGTGIVPVSDFGFRISDLTPKVTDFGLARKLDDVGQTQSGAILGTPSYMAPEQADGTRHSVGPPADVYALGAILYECLTGRPPFRAATVADTLLQVIGEEPVPPSRLQSKTPRDLETICLKCLHKEPGRRYDSALSLADDLGRYQRGEPILARPVGQLGRAWRWCRRKPVVAGLTGAVVFLLVAGTAVAASLALLAARRATEAETALREAESLLYAHSLQSARQQWSANRLAHARESLVACPPALREWEWHYLSRLCEPDCRVLHEFDEHLTRLAWAPDGERLAVGGRHRGATEYAVLILDVRSGEVLRTIPLPQYPDGTDVAVNNGVGFSPDGKQLAVSSGGIKLFDPATGQALWSSGAPTQGVVWSADGKRLATIGKGGNRQGVILVLDAKRGAVLSELKAQGGQPRALAFSNDGKRLAVYQDPGELHLWDIERRSELESTKCHTPSIRFVSVPELPEDVLLMAYSDRLAYWLPRRKQEGEKERWRRPTGYAELRHREGILSPDMTIMACAEEDGLISLWNANVNRPPPGMDLRACRGLATRAHALAFRPDGAQLAVLSSEKEDRKVRTLLTLWNVRHRQEWRELPLPGQLANLEFRNGNVLVSRDGDVMVVQGQLVPRGDREDHPAQEKRREAWDAEKGERLFAIGNDVKSLGRPARSPDGERIAIASQGRVSLWDTRSGKVLTVVGEGKDGSVNSLRFAGKDRLFYYTSHGVLHGWDLVKEVETVSLGARHGPHNDDIVFSPDGTLFAMMPHKGPAELRDVTDGSLVRQLEAIPDVPIASFQFSEDGALLAASGGEDSGMVAVWDTATGQLRHLLRQPHGTVSGLTFSKDSRRLVGHSTGASGHEGGASPISEFEAHLTIWDTASGRELLSLPAPERPLRLWFSEDGNQLFGRDSRMQPRGTFPRTYVWDAAPAR